jgi:hypothetical protein
VFAGFELHLPQEQNGQAKSAMRAAWKLNAKGGLVRMKKPAEWIERDYPAAAARLCEALEEAAACPSFLASLPGQHECHRKSTVRRADENGPSARQRHRKTLDGIGAPGDGINLRRIMGLQRSVGLGCDPPWIEVCSSLGSSTLQNDSTAARLSTNLGASSVRKAARSEKKDLAG